MYYLIILALLIFTTNCTKNSVDGIESDITLKVGQRTSVDGGNLLVTFKEVSEDSRCPLGVVCIWMGNGSIALELQSEDLVEDDVTLNTSLEPNKIVFKNYEITLKLLEPYPVESEIIDGDDYTVTLVITKI